MDRPSHKRLHPKYSPSDDETIDDDEDVDDDIPDINNTSTDAANLALGDEFLREKFLNCISERLARTKRGNHVTAAGSREKENSTETLV
ncbi:hypothetical protein PENSUB_7287 [Penicillium subrubescens]|uniref:Uncharacterized protein n=1 Tax=Penicillium subrubescens TaxID=1316194 RepID=A0A1Q5TM33_9EURO|nr:hypothetical protein PENSUB_7287 [Penicillium subrubescens]